MPIRGAACTVRVAYAGESLYAAVTTPAAAASLKRGEVWGRHESVTDADPYFAQAARLRQAFTYRAAVSEGQWTAPWVIPLAAALGARRPQGVGAISSMRIWSFTSHCTRTRSPARSCESACTMRRSGPPPGAGIPPIHFGM